MNSLSSFATILQSYFVNFCCIILLQERAANALTIASNTVRLIMGPTGTTVTFSEDIGLPSIFDPKPKRYDPPPFTLGNLFMLMHNGSTSSMSLA